MPSKQSKVEFFLSQLRQKRPASNPKLIVKDTNGKVLREYDLVNEKCSIGRGSSCNIQLPDLDFISEEHLSIVRDRNVPSGYILQDTSKNGTYQGKSKNKIEGTIPLQNGDKFAIGSPQNEDRIFIVFSKPLPLGKQICLYTLYGVSGIVTLGFLYVADEWNKVDVRNIPSVSSGVRIYDRNLKQTLTTRNFSQEVTNQKLDDFSPNLMNALIASEDSRFYWHLGIDPWGIGRAIWENAKGISVGSTKTINSTMDKQADEKSNPSIQGGSTISQQLARTLFPEYVGKDNNLNRKIKEAIIALKLESTYSKDEILRLYLNRIPLGSRNGFENTAQLYFDKSAKELNLSEVATLVAMPPAPSEYNPCEGKGANGLSVKKRDIVINTLVKSQLITQQQADTVVRSVYYPVSSNACATSIQDAKARYFNDYVKEEIKGKLKKEILERGDIALETGIDLQMQEKAELALSQAIKSAGAKHNFSRGAIVTIDKDTGLVKAMVGGESYTKQQYNDSTSAQRSPGSTFKLFAYTAAIKKGISETATYSCTSFTWEGRIYPGCNHGSVGNTDLITGFARSENAIALRVAQDVGLDEVISTARKMGIKSELKRVPELVLGQSEVNLLELTGAYATIASGGVPHQPKAILHIYDLKGCEDKNNISTCRKIPDATSESESVLSPTVANTMISLMRSVVANGTGKNANIPGLEVVGKTGTTEMEGSKRNTDLWFVGFAKGKSEVTGVWLGNEDNSQTTTANSAQAAQLWSDYMSAVYNK
jgi:penicillin-binding protein 1A